jgi:D-beta-D-heptose 7-phosphate kinase/D-beta-D-heptose 1-phosphate adenosyltransferase
MFEKKFLESFSEVKVLIVGDVMLDRYWWGSVNRISPEAPVPIVDLEKTSLTAGGAANVAVNIAGLGAKPYLVGVIGEDEEAGFFFDILARENISANYLVKSTERRTSIKTRIIAHSQHVVRIDRETKSKLSDSEEKLVWENLEKLIDETHIIIVSDYAKGVITNRLVARLITKARENNKYVMVDPKGKNYRKYQGATILTPNRFEVAEVFQLDDFQQATIETAGKKMLADFALEALLITQGEAGMTLFDRKSCTNHLQVTARNVYDVTGAGDTVIACLTTAVGSGASFLEAAKFANQAAGLVVEQMGTTAITLDMLRKSMPAEK